MKAQLTKWGNSLGLRVPRDFAARLNLAEGSRVEIELDAKGRVVVTPAKPRYTLEELLRQCKGRRRIDKEERDWVGSPAAGRELL